MRYSEIRDKLFDFLFVPRPEKKILEGFPRTGKPFNRFLHALDDGITALKNGVNRAFAKFWLWSILVIGALLVLVALQNLSS